MDHPLQRVDWPPEAALAAASPRRSPDHNRDEGGTPCPACSTPAPSRSRVRRIDPPSLLQLVARFTAATAAWAAAGFPVCEQEVFNRRLATCRSCEHWIPEAAKGFGRCARCGCLKTKLWLATERCPDNRWSPDQ